MLLRNLFANDGHVILAEQTHFSPMDSAADGVATDSRTTKNIRFTPNLLRTSTKQDLLDEMSYLN
ncbi:hypothetical protein JW964_13945 [candidate division KSB1 bacterium]|nr:hypothetical protein [candidate division KSB1 bacterium]